MGKHEAKQSPAQYNAEEWAREELLKRDWRPANTPPARDCDGVVYVFDPKDYAYDPATGNVDLSTFVPATDTYKGTGQHSVYVVRAFCSGCGITWSAWDD